MRITLKRANRVYVLSINGWLRTFETCKEAWEVIINTRYVDEKMKILYDLRVLPTSKRKKEAVRQWLLDYPTRTSMDNAVHDILVGNCTLEDKLKRKGYLQ